MVRVKSEVYTKASVKAPRKTTALRGDSSKTPNNGKSSKYSGGNTYFLRSTPAWQKPITSFFAKNGSQDEAADENTSEMDIAACSSASAACSSASSSDPVPGCSKDDSDKVETVEEFEEVIDEDESGDVIETPKDIAACSSASAACSSESESDPVPGCSKDDSDKVETVEECEDVIDEEESVSEVKHSEEQDCVTNGSGKHESNGKNV